MEGKTTTMKLWIQKLEGKNTTLKFWIQMPWSSTIFLPFFSLIRFWIFFRNDFYLVPMSVNLGTVNPTHYIVTDAGSIEIDLIQKVAYALSHMYFNWTGTVKIPAPCQYARKLGKWKKAIFCFQNCSDLLREKNLVIEKSFEAEG